MGVLKLWKFEQDLQSFCKTYKVLIIIVNSLFNIFNKLPCFVFVKNDHFKEKIFFNVWDIRSWPYEYLICSE